MTCACDFIQGAGFGIGPFGSMPFGSSTGEFLALLGEAHLVAANQVMVPYSGEVGLHDPQNPNSPVAPGSWELTVIDPPGAQLRLVQKVEIVTSLEQVLGLPGVAAIPLPAFLVSFDGLLQPGARYHLEIQVEAVAISGCACAEFLARAIRRDAQALDRRDVTEGVQDLANPALDRDTIGGGSIRTYQRTSTGDWALDKSPLAGLRKRILRRVLTVRDRFFHLRGYGIQQEVKALLTVDRLVRLQSQVKAQVLREPEVSQARVLVSRVVGHPGVVSVSIQAETESGETLSLRTTLGEPS